jgi:hypothetical protein
VVPRGALPEHPALLVTHPADAERVFLNGEPAGGLGDIKPRYATATAGPRVLPLPRAALREGPNEIVFSSLLAGLNARFSMGPFLLGERIEVQAAAERLFHPIIATEAAFFSMFIVVFLFYGFLVLKRVVRSDYLFFMAFIALYAASFSLGSNFLHRDQVVEAGYVHAQAILGSLRTLVMLGLVTRVTGNRFGPVFRFFAAVAAGFLVLDLLLPPLTALTALDAPRKLLLAALGVYYLVVSASAVRQRREDACRCSPGWPLRGRIAAGPPGGSRAGLRAAPSRSALRPDLAPRPAAQPDRGGLGPAPRRARGRAPAHRAGHPRRGGAIPARAAAEAAKARGRAGARRAGAPAVEAMRRTRAESWRRCGGSRWIFAPHSSSR